MNEMFPETSAQKSSPSGGEPTARAKLLVLHRTENSAILQRDGSKFVWLRIYTRDSVNHDYPLIDVKEANRFLEAIPEEALDNWQSLRLYLGTP